VLLARLATITQLCFVALVLCGDAIFQTFGKPVPEVVKSLQDSKITYCIMAFFIGNGVQASLLTTGAFEIYFDDKLVFSKLETGQMPQGNELAQLLADVGV